MAEALTPLELPGWIAFNEWRTGLRALRFPELDQDGAARAVLYVDRRGRVSLPPNNPFLPIVYSSARERPSGRTSGWLRASAPLVEEMGRRGTANLVWLAPTADDIRPWRWAGFLVHVGYTYVLELPSQVSAMDRGARRAAARAATVGMTVERVDDVHPVVQCLLETEARKRFAHHLGERELRTARDMLGTDCLRMYLCLDPTGRPAAAVVLIFAPATRAIAWVGGPRTQHRADGSYQLLFRELLVDVSAAGATGLDLCGADIPSVAQFKAEWGGRLTPLYGVRTFSTRAGARFLVDWLRALRRSPAR